MIAPGPGMATTNAQDSHAGTLEYLSLPVGASSGHAAAITDAGYIAGTVAYAAGGCSVVLWDPHGLPRELGFCGAVAGINERLQIAGTMSSQQAFLWGASEGLRLLRSPYGGWSRASDLSEHGWVVGAMADLSGGQTAFVWNRGSGVRDLTRLLGRKTPVATGVNSSGDVIGSKFNRFLGSFVWNERSGIRLVPLLDSTRWRLLSADYSGMGARISDGGLIVGEDARYFGDTHAVLWPVSGPPIDLGMVDCCSIGYSRSIALSETGVVVGHSHGAVDPGERPFVWTATDGIRELTNPNYSCGVSDVSRSGGAAVGSCGSLPVKWLLTAGTP
ncbi:MAG: hypothetical protein IPK85_05595 [Gemmatimonadetes bacterium]|nr:hypothetical protein [Gemmatimonadota bacterium]